MWTAPQEINRSWPALREDLTLYPGPPAANGFPTWTLHDPARNQYFSIDWMTFEVISRMRLKSFEAISASISQETTLELDEDVIKNIISFLDENELIQRHDDVENDLIQQRRDAREKSWFQSSKINLVTIVATAGHISAFFKVKSSI
jgi:putative peptide zinc metalloprotease protein